MKKILSLVLVLSMCLSSVILLASCQGKSAYEIAVENGFVGDEKAWLESLKGEAGEKGENGKQGAAGEIGYPGLPGEAGLDPYAYDQFYEGYAKTVEDWLASLKGTDAFDGHVSKVTVDENGYWVVDGTRQPVKVDGTKDNIASVELATDRVTVTKKGATPQIDIKVKYADGTEAILPASYSVISTKTYDLTKEGVYNVTINYGGVTKDDVLTVEGLMICYEDFDSFTNSAKMAEILGTTGYKIPMLGPNTINTATPKDGDTAIPVYGNVNWWDDGSDITPYLLYGAYHGPNFVQLSVQNGRLFYLSHRQNNFWKAKTASDSMLIFRTDEEMNYAATDTYTIQMDVQFSGASDNGTPDDTSDDTKNSLHPTAGSNNITILTKFMDEGVAANVKNHGRPVMIGASFGAQHLIANVYRKGSWYVGGKALDMAGIEATTENINVLTTLFPEKNADSWFGEYITVRIVVRAKNSENPGYSVYVKKFSEGEDKFIYVGDFNAGTTTTTGMNWFMKEGNDGFGLQTRSSAHDSGYAGFYLDNIAAWTGDGDMPKNTNTATYEDLNSEYNASLQPAA